MNKWQKEVLNFLAQSEEDTLNALEKEYKRALNEIGKKVKEFQTDIDMLDAAIASEGLSDAAKAQLQTQRRSKIYQKRFQEALQGQVNGILDRMQGATYSTIEAYLKRSYEDSFIGTMYDIAGQGIPLIVPIDQAAAIKAVLTDSKVSKGLYNALGVDVAKLKRTIRSEISRGIATSLPYSDIARNITNVTKAPMGRAKTIVRTEGHRIQQASTMDAQNAAKARGADVVKQWDASLDSRTRESHRRLDGQIREVEEPFEIGGREVMAPGYFGNPAEDCNCRCVSLTRARWALDEDELQTLKDRAEYFGLDKTKDFEDFKEKYLGATKKLDISESNGKMKLPNIPVFRSVGAKARNFDIELPNKEFVRLTEGSWITDVEVIAGKGRERQIDIIDILLYNYPGTKAGEWKKVKGIGYVDYHGESYKTRLHWYEEPSVGRVKFKVKPDKDGNWFYDD